MTYTLRWAAKAWLVLSVLLGWAVLAQAANAGASDDEDRFHGRNPRDGWFWYRDPPAPVKPPEPPASAPVVVPVPTPAVPEMPKDLKDMKAFQKRVEEALQMATYNPTEANVTRYMQLWQESMNKASAFTDVAKSISWRTPSLNADFQGVRPTSPAAQQTFDMESAAQKSAMIQQLARTHGLFFFFRSDCKYCHAMAPYLKQFERMYGMTVYPVSMDGGGLPDFPRAQRDNGIAQRFITELGIPPQEFQVPFTVLASPKTREILPVGFGVMGVDDVVERITLVMQMRTRELQQQQAEAPGARSSVQGMGPRAVNPAAIGVASMTTRMPLQAPR